MAVRVTVPPGELVRFPPALSATGLTGFRAISLVTVCPATSETVMVAEVKLSLLAARV